MLVDGVVMGEEVDDPGEVVGQDKVSRREYDYQILFSAFLFPNGFGTVSLFMLVFV
jgi:hypothetical protein